MAIWLTRNTVLPSWVAGCGLEQYVMFKMREKKRKLPVLSEWFNQMRKMGNGWTVGSCLFAACVRASMSI